jgi:hypothetical protein
MSWLTKREHSPSERPCHRYQSAGAAQSPTRRGGRTQEWVRHESLARWFHCLSVRGDRLLQLRGKNLVQAILHPSKNMAQGPECVVHLCWACCLDVSRSQGLRWALLVFVAKWMLGACQKSVGRTFGGGICAKQRPYSTENAHRLVHTKQQKEVIGKKRGPNGLRTCRRRPR